MKKIILYGHDGSANHGCEALVRTTAELLKNKSNEVMLISYRPEEDIRYGIDKLCQVKKRGDQANKLHKDIDFFRAYYQLKVKHDYGPMDDLAEAQATGGEPGDIAVAIGGDSYCYGRWSDPLIHQFKIWKQLRMKTVLWGCSIEPELLEAPNMLAHFQAFDLITARESISYEALKRINPNTILVADSAFLLDEVRLPMPAGFEDKETVGINVSPLVEEREARPGIVRRSFEYLIESILKDTHYHVLLIPHVVWNSSDDRTVLRELLAKYQHSGRIAMVEDHNCRELKGYISRCRFFIGARTHATIAAYSTGVPTLVLGYSTKSRGIAKDLFGTYENYVLPTQELRDEMELTEKWNWLRDHEEACRSQLQRTLPDYIQRVYQGKRAVAKLSK